MLDGLYKVEYGVNDAFGRSIMCMHDGKLLGGNSAFAHLGTYHQSGDEIAAEVITERHNDDPHYKPLMGTDVAAISVRGRLTGNRIRFEGSAAPRPGALFWADLTRLETRRSAQGRSRTGRHRQRALFHPHPHPRRYRWRPVRRDAADRRPHSRRRRLLLLSRLVQLRRTAAGRARSSIRSTRRRRAKIPCSAATRSASGFPGPAMTRARNWKPLRWPASAACA